MDKSELLFSLKCTGLRGRIIAEASDDPFAGCVELIVPTPETSGVVFAFKYAASLLRLHQQQALAKRLLGEYGDGWGEPYEEVFVPGPFGTQQRAIKMWARYTVPTPQPQAEGPLVPVANPDWWDRPEFD